MKEKIRVVLVKTNEDARITEIENTVDGIKQSVGGDYEGYCLFQDPVILICRADGKFNDEVLPNRGIFDKLSGELRDVVHGDFIIVSAMDDEDLPEDLAKKYKSKFEKPDLFINTPKGIGVIPYDLAQDLLKVLQEGDEK